MSCLGITAIVLPDMLLPRHGFSIMDILSILCKNTEVWLAGSVAVGGRCACHSIINVLRTSSYNILCLFSCTFTCSCQHYLLYSHLLSLLFLSVHVLHIYARADVCGRGQTGWPFYNQTTPSCTAKIHAHHSPRRLAAGCGSCRVCGPGGLKTLAITTCCLLAGERTGGGALACLLFSAIMSLLY